MAIEFDDHKRRKTLEHRQLDFARADEVLAGLTLTMEDDRHDYGETRYLTIGLLDKVVVVVIWTPRGDNQRFISMRKGNDKETLRYTGVGGP